MLDSIRTEIMQKAFAQCAKMLDPNPNNQNGFDYTNPDPNSEYNRVLVNSGGNDQGRFDFGLLEPAGEELFVIQNKIKYIKFGMGVLNDLYTRGLMPAIFIENATRGHDAAFQNIEIAKDAEVSPITVVLVMVEQKPSQRTMPEYRSSNPIFASQVREQLDYFLDRKEFLGISSSRIGYSLPSKVHDAKITLSQNLQGVKAPFEIIHYRFEVIFDKQKERD